MPTTEQTLTELTNQASLLMDLPQQIADTAAVQIASVTTAYNTRIAALSVTCYVDQTNGSDANAGTLASPYQTITKAVAAVPRGGLGTIILIGDYTMTSVVFVDGKRIRVKASGTVRTQLQFSRLTQLIIATTYRVLANFALSNGSSIVFEGLTLVMPPLDGTWGTYPTHGNLNGLVTLGQGINHVNGIPAVGIYLCDLAIPATPFSALINNEAVPHSLHLISVVTTDQDYKGKFYPAYTNTAGTATGSIPHLVTNLTLV